MNGIQSMVNQAIATNHTASAARELPVGFGKLIKDALSKTDAAVKAVEGAKGRWQTTAAALFESGWRLAHIDASVVGKANRDVLRSSMVDNWPNASERAALAADPKTLDQQTKDRVRAIRQSFGANFALIEKYLGELAAKAAAEAAAAAGAAAPTAEETTAAAAEEAAAKRLKQFRKAVADAIRYAGEMEGVKQEDGTAVDLVATAAELKAILGRFPA
jgi:hypothetical protein